MTMLCTGSRPSYGKVGAFFSRGTICYRVQDVDGKEYAMKDYWVDAAQIENEVTLLRMVAGIPNVVQLVKYWDVVFDGQPDSTSRIRAHCTSFKFENKFHRRMLLTPCGLPLKSFKSVTELVEVFRHLVLGEFFCIYRKSW